MSIIHSHPLVSALLGGAIACGGLVALDWHMSPRLTVPAINAVEAPTLDGDISDEAWAAATPVTVLTSHGGDFGGSGESRIQVRAVRDSRNVYIALEWDDPSRSLEYLPLVKDDGTWRSLETDADTAGEARFFDDRIAVMLASPGVPLIGAGIHLGTQPLDGAPASTTGRGLHYTAPGTWVDLWQWHAAVGALTDRVDDGFLGAPRPATPAQRAGKERYLGGIGTDDPDAPVATANFVAVPGADDGTLQPVHLPRSGTATLDDIPPEAGLSDPPDQTEAWAIRESASIPYSAATDAALADGTVIPGMVVDDSTTPGPNDVTARGAWAGGHWVLELKRSLDGGAKDLDFENGIMLWFAVFDHSQTRHTYHLRPLIVEMS